MDYDLEKINERPKLFEFYTAEDLWNDDYISEKMLAFHLNGDVDVSSRKTEFIDRSVDWIYSYFNLQKRSEVLDFGCGPGLYAQRLALKGASVTGVDFSRRSIQYAKDMLEQNKLSINYVNQNYLEFETDERFDLILMIMCDFCALSPAQRKTMLSKFSRFLNSDGRVLFDVYSLNAFQQRQEELHHKKNLLDGFWSSKDYDGYLNVFKYDDEKAILDKYTIIENDRKRVVYNWLQYFSLQSLNTEVEEGGFLVEKMFGNVAGEPYDCDSNEFAVVLRKA